MSPPPHSHALSLSISPSPPSALRLRRQLRVLYNSISRRLRTPTVNMVNPFIDDQAYQDDEEYDEDAGGGDEDDEDGEAEYNEKWSILGQGRWLNEDDAPPEGLEYNEFVQYLAERYGNGPAERERSSPLLLQTPDDELENFVLQNTLLSIQMNQCFWRIRCTPGEEALLVFDILQHESERTITLDPNDPFSSQTPSATISPVRDAIECIRRFAESPTLSVDTVVDKLTHILGQNPLPQLWRNAVDKAITEPDEDLTAGVNRFNEILPSLMKLDAANPPSNLMKSPDTRSMPPALDEHRTLSAFVAPTVVGSVYLEAYLGKNPQTSDLVEFLRGHPAAIKTGSLGKGQTKRRVWIEPISSSEIAQLLGSVPIQSNIKPGTWVRITKGLYSEDIGLVLRREIGLAQRRLAVLLVPRLPPPSPPPSLPERPPHPNHPLADDVIPSTQPLSLLVSCASTDVNLIQTRKRKRRRERYPQGLFDHSVWKSEHFGEERYRARKQEFEYGLLVGGLSYNAVSQMDIAMDDITRRLFKQSRHPILDVVHFPVSSDWHFFVNDRVKVIHGAPLTVSNVLNPECPVTETYLKDGTIHTVEQSRCLVQFREYAELDAQDTQVWVRNINLRKMFMIGDLVKVEAGEKQGRVGLVLTSYGDEIIVAETGDRQGEIPWINRHVTIYAGQFNQYTGVVVDVLPPRPNHTMLDIRVPELMQTVRVKHDHVLDTCSNRTLHQTLPLSANQQYFKQASWDHSFAPNLNTPPVDRHTKEVLNPGDALDRQPDQPWIGAEVMIIKGAVKQRVTLKAVERNHQVPSGLRVLVELHFISAEHGAVPQIYVNYEAIRDPVTFTLPQPGSSTPLWNNTEFVDPFQTPSTSQSSPTASTSPSHWTLDPRLDGKEFFVSWKPLNGGGLSKVVAKPDCKHQRILLTHSLNKWFVSPQEVYNLALSIKPTTNKDPLIAVRGEHTGKHVRHIFYTYVPDEEEPRITAVVYLDWGTAEERVLEEREGEAVEIQIRAKDCAWAAYDPNKAKFKDQIAALRARARTSEKGKGPRRPHKPKARQ
ncbi:hypothetical protein K435DRAFT_791268 [Dendrothele bispora CBS 962.96]|uniref:Chromatin elongation factor spt5 n=1 Tax=Dendrothele bispora (strain CBS 962.96) TaxID=1314807 RepID=A0A4S8MMT5_DENBC|nr:hypothetical protein K435DRAFT_791268 [Dendrothele bispora CBS 962.96]